MRIMNKISMFWLAVCLAGCAGNPPVVGDSVDTVKLKLGQPTATYSAGSERMLEYASGPMGQYTWMARIGGDGRLVSYEQVLTGQKFALITVGTATKDDVLRTIGRPAEHSYLPLRDYEVWSYRYKESGVWDSMMHVEFDRAGIVRKMENGPDPRYDKSLFAR